jgi:hypothetical protein
MTTNDNDLILMRLRGAPAKQASKLEALMDPTYPQLDEANDNDAVTLSCGCVFCDLELKPTNCTDGLFHLFDDGRTIPCTKIGQE